MTRWLITGMAGGLARLVGEALLERGDEVVGVDYREAPPGLPSAIPFYRANYNKTRIEDVFRRHEPERVLHLGRVGNLKVKANKRFDLNVVGSAKVMELSLKYGVKRLLVLSTFHIYGAHPQNHIPISEDEPLRAGQTFPQLADAVQLDNQAVTWVFRHRTLKTVVLRPCNVVGPHVHNAISTFLRQPTLISLLGYSPIWQFIHERDMLRAVLAAADGEATGVFNVAGSGEIPLVSALELTQKRVLFVPGLLASAFLKVSGSVAATFPSYLLDFFRYPCVINDAPFRKAFGWAPQVGIAETVSSTVA